MCQSHGVAIVMHGGMSSLLQLMALAEKNEVFQLELQESSSQLACATQLIITLLRWVWLALVYCHPGSGRRMLVITFVERYCVHNRGDVLCLLIQLFDLGYFLVGGKSHRKTMVIVSYVTNILYLYLMYIHVHVPYRDVYSVLCRIFSQDIGVVNFREEFPSTSKLSCSTCSPIKGDRSQMALKFKVYRGEHCIEILQLFHETTGFGKS